MARMRRLWVPVLVGLLVAGVLGPVGGVGANETRTMVTRTITVPAAAFGPSSSDIDYENSGYHLWLNSGSGGFTAPLFFEAPEVTIRKITLFAFDNNNAGDICVWPYRTVPGDQELMGTVCSSGASLEVRQFTQRDFAYRRIAGRHGPFLRLSLPGDSGEGYYFYGVRVTYSYDTGA